MRATRKKYWGLILSLLMGGIVLVPAEIVVKL